MTKRFDLGKRVKATREKQGLTQQQLADRLGWHKAAISKIENGATPLWPTVDKLLEALGVSETLGAQGSRKRLEGTK